MSKWDWTVPDARPWCASPRWLFGQALTVAEVAPVVYRGRPQRSQRMEGITWPTDGPEQWPAADGDLSLSPRNLLQPFSNTQGDLTRLGWDAADCVGPKLNRLVVGEGRGVQDTGSGEVLSEDLERDSGREPRGAPEHLDES